MNEKFLDEMSSLLNDYPQFKAELFYQEWQTDFLRFFRSQVNYNVSRTSYTLFAKIHKGKKSYAFSITNPTTEKVKSAIDDCATLIDKLPDDPDFVDIENDLTIASGKDACNNIEKLSLERKLQIIEELSSAVEPYDFRTYGTFICNYQSVAIINSNKLNKRSVSSPVMLEIKAVSNKTDVTVLENFGSENIALLDMDALAKSLVAKVESAKREITDVEPGEYEVILAPRCIGEYCSYLAYAGFSAGSLDHKNSFFEGKVNQQLFPETVTLIDDPTEPGIIAYSYNSEGHIYRKTPLIEKGIFKNFLVDNYYSYKTGLAKNGAEGNCLVMLPGDKSLEEIIASTKKGLYISSLHYMNYINPKETSITGLTRDGTFLIEDGKITKVVNNLRFTVKITDVLSNIKCIEDKNHPVAFSQNYDEFSITSVKMPHVKVEKFKISSSTRTI